MTHPRKDLRIKRTENWKSPSSVPDNQALLARAWHTPVFPGLGKLRQEDGELKTQDHPSRGATMHKELGTPIPIIKSRKYLTEKPTVEVNSLNGINAQLRPLFPGNRCLGQGDKNNQNSMCVYTWTNPTVQVPPLSTIWVLGFELSLLVLKGAFLATKPSHQPKGIT